MRKITFLLTIIILLTGCTSSEFNNEYKKMIASSKGISGYSFDVLVSYDNKYTNARIMNYQDTKFTINYDNTRIFIDDKKQYLSDDTAYKLNKDKLTFANPLLYLRGLKNVSTVLSKSKITIGVIKYDSYSVNYTNKFIDNLLEEVGINSQYENHIGEIYIDPNGYLYRLIYYIDNIKIYVNYFEIDKINDIKINVES